MNVGSLFAGIGGFELGLERAGFEIEWQVEVDPYCRAVLERHFPQAHRFEDVRAVGAANLAPVDVICGGFPCQDLSAAGKGAGIDGARSGLWSEFARIVRELRPRYVLVENVPALLTGKGKRWDRAPIGRVLGDLAEVGYDAEWARLSAREFGAPHLRQRVWIVAYPGEAADAEILGRGTRGARRPACVREDGSVFTSPELAERRREAGASTAAAIGTDRGVATSREGGANSHADPCRLEGIAQLDREAASGRCEAAFRRHPHRLRHPVSDADRLGRSQRLREPAGTAKSTGQADVVGGGECTAGCGRCGSDPWAVEPDVGRVAHGVPDRVDRLAALGNALVPQIPEWIGRRILDWEAAGR